MVAVNTPGPVRLREVADAIGMNWAISLLKFGAFFLGDASRPKIPLASSSRLRIPIPRLLCREQRKEQPWQWKTVRVHAEKSIKQLAKKYDVTTDTVAILNRIRGTSIPEDRKLLILPVWKAKSMKRGKKRLALSKLTTQIRRFRWNYPALRLERKLIPVFTAYAKATHRRQLSQRHGVSQKLLVHYNGARPLRKGTWIRLRQWARCHHLQKRKPTVGNGNVALFTSDAHD